MIIKYCSVQSTQVLPDSLCSFILSASTDHSASQPNLTWGNNLMKAAYDSTERLRLKTKYRQDAKSLVKIFLLFFLQLLTSLRLTSWVFQRGQRLETSSEFTLIGCSWSWICHSTLSRAIHFFIFYFFGLHKENAHIHNCLTITTRFRIQLCLFSLNQSRERLTFKLTGKVILL